MEFEWDEAKSEACLVHRGFDFEYAVRAFRDPHRTVTRDQRRDCGEKRYRLPGGIKGRVSVSIYTMRGSAIRLISARRASKRENREYERYAYQV